MNSNYDYCIIGGGIIGISTAYILSKSYPEKKIIILEKESSICQHQSGRNSGVIHSGIYYKPGSLKALNCIRGYKMLLEFCDLHKIPYNVCGKLIVSTSVKESIELEKLYQRGIQHGLEGLRKLTYEEAKLIEPNVKCREALFVEQTGITDYTLIAKKLLDLAIQNNVKIQYNARVTELINNKGECVIVKTNDNLYTCYSKVINCGGLHSDELGKLAGDSILHKIMPFKGEFYKIKDEKSNLVNRLIYPVPNPEFPFLGVHLTKMINGNVKAGPNAILAFKKEGYKKFEFNLFQFLSYITYLGLIKLIFKYRNEGLEEMKRSISKKLFHKSINQIFEGIELEDLIPYKPGIRAQALYKNGQLEDDFLLKNDGIFLHVYNSPSPAATACLSIAEQIVSKV